VSPLGNSNAIRWVVETVNLEPGIKVWQPQGFEGLEIESLNKPSFLQLSCLLTDYEFTVQLGGYATSLYCRKHYSSNASWARPVMYMQSPGEVVSASTRPDDPITAWTLRISPEVIASMLQDRLEKPGLTVAFPQAIPGTATFNHALAVKTRDVIGKFIQPASRLERDSAVFGLVMENIQHCGDLRFFERRFGNAAKVIERIKEYLHEQYSSEASLMDLAELVQLNKFHLLQVFKREIGITPHVYQTLLRLRRAKKQLAVGMPIAQVAHEVGFVDQSHLNRQFKKYVKVTPGQFQRDSLGG
jgi:AraC-like DNA-binding protein